MTASPLTADQLSEIAAARWRARKARRATVVALVSAWTIAVFAGLSLLLGAAMRDWVSVVLGVAMGAIAFFEFRGAGQLRRLDWRGARVLGFNQLAFAALLVAYSAWQLVNTLRAPPSPELAQLAGSGVDPAAAEDLVRLAAVLLYGSVALVGLLGPGLTAVYYFTRARVIRRFVEQTPTWVLEVLRAGA